MREQPRAEALQLIADQLDKLAKLYQVPAWDGLNSILLAEWIAEEYSHDQMQTVMACLTSPKSATKTWRLTPDTIREWMAAEQDKFAARREKYIHNKKVEKVEPGPPEEISEATQKLINEYQEQLLARMKKVMPISQQEIIMEGQEKPIPKSRPVLPMTEVEMEIRDLANQYGVSIEQIKDLRYEWMRQCFDIYTGKPNIQYRSFREWIQN